MARRKRSDSIDAQLAAAATPMAVPPPDVKFCRAEMVIWNQVVKTRTEWRAIDLIMLSKVVRLEHTLRGLWDALKKHQALSPEYEKIVKHIHTLQSQQSTIFTKLSLTVNKRAEALNSTAKQERQRDQAQTKQATSLLAVRH